MNFSATDDQLENSFLDPYRQPDSSFFSHHSSFLGRSLLPDPLTPRRRSEFWPSTFRRAKTIS